MTREECSLLAVASTVPVQRDALSVLCAGPSWNRNHAMRRFCSMQYLEPLRMIFFTKLGVNITRTRKFS